MGALEKPRFTISSKTDRIDTTRKRVEVFYLIDGDKIITVTVYVFYGKWEG